jgi:UDP-N-acetylglucosamine:LPS N-acetylglucosamine transferase
MILQQDLTGESLAAELKALINAPEQVTEMETKARALARGDAAATTVDLMEELAGCRSQAAGN